MKSGHMGHQPRVSEVVQPASGDNSLSSGHASINIQLADVVTHFRACVLKQTIENKPSRAMSGYVYVSECIFRALAPQPLSS
ncbi:MAG: hypothetical protein ACI9OU_002509 [Candidatus Promineifilaceae bacterium]|jgi:hypothetical protein